MVNAGVNLGQLVKGEGVTFAHRAAVAALLVCGKVLIANRAGLLGGLPENIRPRAGKNRIRVSILGVELGKDGGHIAAVGGGKAGLHNRAADLAALVILIVDVLVKRNRADHQGVIVFLHGKLLSPAFGRRCLCACRFLSIVSWISPLVLGRFQFSQIWVAAKLFQKDSLVRLWVSAAKHCDRRQMV